MLTTYLCGGINGLSDSECKDWREKAKELLITETLDPMRRDYRGKETSHAAEIVAKDLEDINNSDFILVNASKPSWGTAMEIAYAFCEGKDVIAFTGGNVNSTLSPWLTYHCNKVFVSLDAAVMYVNRLVRDLNRGFK